MQDTASIGAASQATGKLCAGDVAPRFSVDAVDGTAVDVPDSGKLVHLQFRRFAGCPICNLHLRSIARRHDELVRAGIREIAVFHSSAEHLRSFGELPFAVIPDPERRLYRAYLVEPSLRAVLDPRAWPAAIGGLLERRPSLASVTAGGPLGLPADFLIGPDGRIVALKYGAHADDQWSAEEILALASR